jgi:diguanylate cyclase (GGDEF)-like protein
VAGLAGSWLRAVASVHFIPGPRARARAVFEDLLARLKAAMRAEPFDPSHGYRIGADLVHARVSSPAALRVTLTLLGQDLLPTIDAVDAAARKRLAILLGQLAEGFTDTLRDAAANAAEEINRAERAAWRREQIVLHRRLQHALLHDPVTGLANRAHLLEWLATQVRDGDRLGVCVFSLDRFGAVNASLGPHAGDRLLREVARRLRPVATRHGHLLAHLAADEFALAVTSTLGPEDVVKAVDEILRTLPNPFVTDGHPLPVTVKAGIAEQTAITADPMEFIRAASIALGWAKADPHRSYAIYDPERSAADIRRHRLTAAMPAALRNGEFALDYQLLVRLADRVVIGAEALVRWHHPTLGVLGPGQFIDLAERTGLIESLGLYLLERACTEAAVWQDCPTQPFVSVNISPVQLAQPGLVAAVAAVLDRTQYPPARLQLEITESASLEAHHQVINELAELGIQLAIDDFGTGYSSLASLAGLPIHTVKLAADFLHGITVAQPATRAATVLHNLIIMCHDLGINVTAEGIEKQIQARYATALGCDAGQGFHLAEPAGLNHVTEMLRRGTI